MNLKKNDKIIIIIGVLIIVVASIFIYFYTSADSVIMTIPTEPELKTYDITWK